MATRIMNGGAEKVYSAAAAWVEQALRTDGSLFTLGESIWTSHWLGELRQRFLNHPDESSASFLEKLEAQLKDSPPEIYQLMGETLYFYFLVVSTKNSTNEQRVIGQVLGWSPSPVSIPPALVAGLTPGIVNPGQNFHSGRPFQVGYLIEFVEQWKGKGSAHQHRLLADPWEFRDFARGLDFRSALLKNSPNRSRTQREALLHLVFPDIFEAIVSVDHKDKIAESFAKFVTQPEENVDRRLEQIRPRLEAQYGSTEDHFYYSKPEVRRQWDDNYNLNHWDDFVSDAQRYFDSGRLEKDEIEYKVEIGRKLEAVRKAVFTRADDWADLLKQALNTREGNIINWRSAASLNRWCIEHPDEALRALQAIWTEDVASVSERASHFSDLLPDSVVRGPGTRLNLVSVLLMGLDVEQYPPFLVSTLGGAYERTGYDQPAPDSNDAALHDHALGFLDRFIDEASVRGLNLRHRLDAQSMVWAIVNSRGADPPEGEGPKQPHDPWDPVNIELLAKELFWEYDGLQNIVDGLNDKRQAIFQGPPGTGKTYVAKRIAEWCQEHGGEFEIVQFHPSYSYEDFVEGFRPTLTAGGQAGFKLTKGPLRLIAEKAEDNPDSTYILVIDEINRGNVAKVLGELYFLLEYRDHQVTLQYSAEKFSLPENLWFIGTMNTTDRSIALVDAALRRRFYFFGFFPDEPPVQGLLNLWLEDHNPEAKWVAELVDLANHKLADRHLGIGPSYFMKKELPLDEKRVRFIWEQAVIPYIEEQCFGDEDKLKEFAYGRLKRELDSKAHEADDGSAHPEVAPDEGKVQPEGGTGDASP